VGYGYGGFRGSMGMGDSVGIPTGFSVGMGRVCGLKSNPNGSPGTRQISAVANEPARLNHALDRRLTITVINYRSSLEVL